MKTANTAKKQTSQPQSNDGAPMNKNANSHIKIVKPRPHGSETSVQGPRDCFPLG